MIVVQFRFSSKDIKLASLSCVYVYAYVFQDDSSLNVKVVAKLIESEKVGTFANAILLTADDGTSVVEQLRNEMAAGRVVHFILMDFIMAGHNSA